MIRQLFCLITLLISVCLVQQVMASDCSIPASYNITERPAQDQGPTPVKVGVYILDLHSIDDIRQTFGLDVYASAVWHDPRLARDQLGKSLEKCKIKYNQIWEPNLRILNSSFIVHKVFPDTVTINNEGVVHYTQRARAMLFFKLYIHDFPFDKHILPITITSFPYTKQDIAMQVDEALTGRRSKFTITGWSIAPSITTRIYEEQFKPMNTIVPMLRVEMHVKRDAGFYIWKVMLSLCFIVLMAWCVFWIDPTQLAAQLGVSTATVLTLIAFRFAVGNLVPKVSYLTILDQFMLVSTLFVFIALAETVFTSVLVRRGYTQQARRVDVFSRWSYPLLYLVFISAIFICK